jgi:hypothetical protein
MAKEIKVVVAYEMPSFMPGDSQGVGMSAQNESGAELMRTHNLTTLQHIKDMARPIQLWYRMNDEKQWEYNHFNWGHDAKLRHPPAKHPDHVKAWKNGKWAYRFAFLSLSKVDNIQEMVIIAK